MDACVPPKVLTLSRKVDECNPLPVTPRVVDMVASVRVVAAETSRVPASVVPPPEANVAAAR